MYAWSAVYNVVTMGDRRQGRSLKRWEGGRCHRRDHWCI